MWKNNKKKIKKYFILLVFVFSLFFITTKLTSAQTNFIEFKPQIPIPGLSTQGGISTDPVSGNLTSDLLGRYIQAIYTYGLSIAGILAAIVMMAGGLLWLTSGGSENKISRAKTMIVSSLIGLLLLFSAWMILNTINPALLKMNTISLTMIKPVPEEKYGCCVAPLSSPLQSSYYSAIYTTNRECEDYPEIDNKKSSFYENMIPNPRLESTASCEEVGCCNVEAKIFTGNIISSTTNFNFPSTRQDCEGADYTAFSQTTKIRYIWSNTACKYSSNITSCHQKPNGSTCFDYSSGTLMGWLAGGSACIYSGQCGFCYNNFCLTKLGQVGEICGGDGGQGTCQPRRCNQLNPPVGLRYESVSGGRNCTSGSWCCRLTSQ